MHHIKQVAGDPQAAQINLLRHQCTELPSGKYKKKRPPVKSKQSHHKPQSSESYHLQVQHKERFDPKSAHNNKDRCSKCGDTAHLEGFQCPEKNTNVKLATSLATLQAYASRKSTLTSNPEGLKHTSCKQVQCMQNKVPHMTTQMRKALLKILFPCKSRSNASRTKNKRCQDQPDN